MVRKLELLECRDDRLQSVFYDSSGFTRKGSLFVNYSESAGWMTTSPEAEPKFRAARPSKPPIIVVDEATITRVRGWALNMAMPDESLVLSLLVNGTEAWTGSCDQKRPDVARAGHHTEQAGFDVWLVPGDVGQSPAVLTVQSSPGVNLTMLVSNRPCQNLTLAGSARAVAPPDTASALLRDHADECPGPLSRNLFRAATPLPSTLTRPSGLRVGRLFANIRMMLAKAF